MVHDRCISLASWLAIGPAKALTTSTGAVGSSLSLGRSSDPCEISPVVSNFPTDGGMELSCDRTRGTKYTVFVQVSSQQCCGVELFDVGSDIRCCGKIIYNVNAHICGGAFGGSIIAISPPSFEEEEEEEE